MNTQTYLQADQVNVKRTTIAEQVISTLQSNIDGSTVSIWEFEHKITNKPDPNNPSTWDWTPAFQAAIALLDNGGLNPAVSGGCILVPPAIKNIVYRVTELEIPLGMCLSCVGATIAPLNYADTRTHLIKFMGMNKVIGLHVSMDYTVTYTTAIWCRGRNMDFSACAVWFAPRATQIGEASWATDPATSWLGDSEISFSNCQFNWCLKASVAYGLNTIVVYGAGSRVYSNPGSIPSGHPNAAAWAAMPRGNCDSYGALVYLVGAFLGTFTRDVPSLTSYAVPTNVPDYVSSYGRFVLDGTHVETSMLLYAPAPSGFTVDDAETAILIMNNCQGHVATSPTDGYWITCSSSVKQKICISNVSFYGTAGVTPTRTKLITAPQSRVEMPFDSASWSCISGEIKSACNILFPINKKGMRLVTAFGANQTITTGSSTLLMPSLGEIDLVPSARTSYYNPATGSFTAAVEMHNVSIDIDLRYVTPSSLNTVTLDLVVSGVTVDTVVASGAFSRVSLKTRRIAKGASFVIRAVGAASYALDGSANTKFSLVADV